MKIVHISTSDKDGGASIAAYRLHQALLSKGVTSKMLVATKTTDELNIYEANSSNLEKHVFSKVRSLFTSLDYKRYKGRENPILFSSGKHGIDISEHDAIKEADILHVHWINSGYLDLNTLKKLFELNKIVVFTLHDMWLFTGGCHYSSNCNKYQNSCGNCPILQTNKENDTTKKVWKQKVEKLKPYDFSIITCSKWLEQCAKESSLLRKKSIVTIPNVLDEKVFKNIDKEIARDILNLDKNKKYITFGALSSTSDPRKGFKYLLDSLTVLDKSIKYKDDIELLIFGSSYSNEPLPFKTNFLGRINDEYTLSLLYNASDVFLSPSVEDNLPNTVLESLSCRTPVVAFDIGGMRDMIVHKKNGYLATPFNCSDFSLGIQYCLENELNYINKNLSTDIVIKKIICFYEKEINHKN